MKYLAVLLSLIFFIAEPLFAHTVERRSDQVFEFPVDRNASGLQESDVQALLQFFDQEFSQSLKNPSKSWMSAYDWKQPYLGAGSMFDGENFSIMLWGGLIRAQYMNIGALTAVICHEFGHRLGGAPYQKFPGQDHDWSSAEGQSDYFAASVCLPRMYDRFQRQAPQWIVSQLEPATVSLCRDSREPQKCQWIATAGVDMIQTLQVYYERDIPFADPQVWSQEVVSETLSTQYPSYQCRMDIFKSAARDPKASRLACWYK